MTNRRVFLACSLAGITTAAGWMAGCGKSSPTGPTTSGLAPGVVTALTVRGNPSLTAPGQTTQLTLEATLADGSRKEVAATGWSSSNTRVVTISPGGLMTAVDFGGASIVGNGAGATTPVFPVTV